jgi:hypothetical protein
LCLFFSAPLLFLPSGKLDGMGLYNGPILLPSPLLHCVFEALGLLVWWAFAGFNIGMIIVAPRL